MCLADTHDVIEMTAHPVLRITRALEATCDRIGFKRDTIHRRAVIQEALRVHRQGDSVAVAVQHGMRVAKGLKLTVDARREQMGLPKESA